MSPSLRPRSLLLECPIELFYDICWHVTDIRDITTLAHIPEVKERLKQVVRVVAGTTLNYLDPVFEDFPRASLTELAPEYSINLCEVDAVTKVPRAVFADLFLVQKNIKNMLMMVGMTALHNRGDNELEWVWPEVTLVERQYLKRRFTLKCVLIITVKDFTLTGSTFSSGRVHGPSVETLNLKNVTLLSQYTMQGLRPKLLTVENCSDNWIHAIDYENIRNLKILHKLPDDSEYAYKVQPDPTITSYYSIVFKDFHFSQMRSLDLENVNCLSNISLPSLEKLHLKIVPLTKKKNQLIVPMIRNIYAPCCTDLSLELHLVLPEVSGIDMANCQKLTIRACDILSNPTNDPQYYLDVKDRFGIYSEDESRTVSMDIFGWPHAKDITLIDCSHLFRNLDFLTDGVKLTLVFDSSEEESHIYVPDSHGIMPHLRKLSFIDTMLSDCASINEPYCPQYRIDAFGVEELFVSRGNKSCMYLNYESMVDNFPVLKSLHINGCNAEDKFPDGRAILRHLTRLRLENYDVSYACDLVAALEQSPLEDIYADMYSYSQWGREFTDDFFRMLTLKNRPALFENTLKSSSVFMRGPVGVEGLPGSFSIMRMFKLQDMRIGGFGKLLVKDCPMLEKIEVLHNGALHLALLADIPVEEGEEGFRSYNLNAFIRTLDENDVSVCKSLPAKRRLSTTSSVTRLQK